MKPWLIPLIALVGAYTVTAVFYLVSSWAASARRKNAAKRPDKP